MLTDNLRLKLMLDKLKDQVSRGFIDNEWSEKFILEMYEKSNLNITRTVKSRWLKLKNYLRGTDHDN